MRRKIIALILSSAFTLSCTASKRQVRAYPKKKDAVYYFMLFKLNVSNSTKAESFLNKALSLAPKDEQLKIEAAKFYMKNGDFDKAIRILKTAKSPKAKRLLIMTLLASSNSSAAMKNSKLLCSQTRSPMDCSLFASFLINSANYTGALKALSLPNNETAQLLYLKALSYYGLKRYNQTAEVLSKLLKKAPNFPQAYRLLPKVYEKTKDENLLQLARLSGSEQAMKALIRIYLKDGRTAEAVKVLKKLLKKHPEDAAFLRSLSVNLLEGNRIEDLKKLAQAFSSTFSNSTFGYLMLGIVHEHEGDYLKAIENYEKYLDKNPNDVPVLLEVANLYSSVGAYPMAESYYERLFELTGNAIYASRAVMMRYKSEGPDSAYKLIEKMEKSISKPSRAVLYTFAIVADDAGHFKEAQRFLKEILKKNPQDADALNYLAYLYAKRGVNLKEALKLVKEALKKKPKNPAYIDTLGWVLFKLGDYKKACALLKKAYEANDDPVSLEHLSECQLKMGNSTACEGLRKALEAFKSKEPLGERGIRDRIKKLLEENCGAKAPQR